MSKLALFGGEPVCPAGVVLEARWPAVSDEAMAAVHRVFERGNFIGIHDPEVDALEQEYARYVGTEYAVAVGSGTAALHAAVVAAGCEPGDEVIVPALTFLASATSVLHHMCIPVFADIDPVSYNIDPASVEAAISPNTRAIMAVDLHGLPADYDGLRNVAKKHRLAIIEDAAHATGSQYKGRMAGGLGDVAGTSIMPGKQLPACGEGGLFSTSDAEAQNRASMIRMFGEVIRKDQPRAYNAYTLGWNYRLNPIQAAFARVQLSHNAEYSQRYSENGTYLAEQLKQIPGLIPPHVPQGSTHVYHMFRIRFDPKAAGLDIPAGRFAKAVDDAMAAEGLPFRHYQNIPVPGQAIFQLKQGFGKGLPWTLPGTRDVSYDIEGFPVTLDVIEATRCVGKAGSSGPNYFGSRPSLEYYVKGFQKVWEHLADVAGYAEKLDYRAPWEGIQVPSTRGEWTVLAPSGH